MEWQVEFTDDFGRWWEDLTAEEQESVEASVSLLEKYGPTLPFPHSSAVKQSKHSHMRELRIQHHGSPYRMLHAFDPLRVVKRENARIYGWISIWQGISTNCGQK